LTRAYLVAVYAEAKPHRPGLIELESRSTLGELDEAIRRLYSLRRTQTASFFLSRTKWDERTEFPMTGPHELSDVEVGRLGLARASRFLYLHNRPSGDAWFELVVMSVAQAIPRFGYPRLISEDRDDHQSRGRDGNPELGAEDASLLAEFLAPIRKQLEAEETPSVAPEVLALAVRVVGWVKRSPERLEVLDEAVGAMILPWLLDVLGHLVRQGHIDEARSLARELEPADAACQVEYLEALVDVGHAARARSETEAALQRLGTSPGFVINAGEVYRSLGDSDSAEACYRTALARVAMPGCQRADAVHGLRELLVEEGRTLEARELEARWPDSARPHVDAEEDHGHGPQCCACGAGEETPDGADLGDDLYLEDGGGGRAPGEPLARSEEPGTRRPEAKVGRNEPCPCGSGKKFKKCCAEREQAHPGEAPGTESELALRARTWGQIFEFSTRDKFAPHLQLGLKCFAGDEFAELEIFEALPLLTCSEAEDLLREWLVCDFRGAAAKSLLERYLERSEAQLEPPARRLWQRMLASHTALYEVDSTTPGEEVRLVDLVDGARWAVQDVRGSFVLESRALVAARLVTLDGALRFSRPPMAFPAECKTDLLDAVGRAIAEHRTRHPGRGPAQALKEHASLFHRFDQVRRAVPLPVLTTPEADPLVLPRRIYRLSDRTGLEDRLRTVAPLVEERVDAAFHERLTPGAPRRLGSIYFTAGQVVVEALSWPRLERLSTLLAPHLEGRAHLVGTSSYAAT